MGIERENWLTKPYRVHWGVKAFHCSLRACVSECYGFVIDSIQQKNPRGQNLIGPSRQNVIVSNREAARQAAFRVHIGKRKCNSSFTLFKKCTKWVLQTKALINCNASELLTKTKSSRDALCNSHTGENVRQLLLNNVTLSSSAVDPVSPRTPGFFLHSVVGGAWPFVIGGAINLVNFKWDSGLLNSCIVRSASSFLEEQVKFSPNRLSTTGLSCLQVSWAACAPHWPDQPWKATECWTRPSR